MSNSDNIFDFRQPIKEHHAPSIAPPTEETLEFDESSAKSFAQAVLTSQNYRASIARRIQYDELPAAVEVKLWEYAYGKVVDKVEVTNTTPRLEDMSLEELERNARLYLDVIKTAREKAQTDKQVH